jgi:hypothetical protein
VEVFGTAGILSDEICEDSHGHVWEVVAFDELWRWMQVRSKVIRHLERDAE